MTTFRVTTPNGYENIQADAFRTWIDGMLEILHVQHPLSGAKETVIARYPRGGWYSIRPIGDEGKEIREDKQMKRATGTSLWATSGTVKWDGDAPPYGAKVTAEWDDGEHPCPQTPSGHRVYRETGRHLAYVQFYGGDKQIISFCPFCGEELK